MLGKKKKKKRVKVPKYVNTFDRIGLFRVVIPLGSEGVYLYFSYMNMALMKLDDRVLNVHYADVVDMSSGGVVRGGFEMLLSMYSGTDDVYNFLSDMYAGNFKHVLRGERREVFKSLDLMVKCLAPDGFYLDRLHHLDEMGKPLGRKRRL